MDLTAYEESKFELAGTLRTASALLPNEEPERHYRIRELQARLAEDRFNLVVVGRFSRGKSSLMNAVLGHDWLPTGLVPLTSVITTVTYGTRAEVLLEYQEPRVSCRKQTRSCSSPATKVLSPKMRRAFCGAYRVLPAAFSSC